MNNSLFYKNIKFIIISSSIILSIKYNYYKKIIKDTNQKRIFSATEVYKRVNINPIEFYSNGEMSEYKYGPEDFQSIVVIRYDDKLYAYQNNSPYLGIPLSEGILLNKLLKCPLSGSTFDITNGRVDISPALNNLQSYEILDDHKGEYVNVPIEVSTKGSKPKMAKRDKNNNTKFVIIGGGAAGESAAETLRIHGFTGEIVIIEKEKYLPYNRSFLSKVYISNPDLLYFRRKDFYMKNSIDLCTGFEVNKIDTTEKLIFTKEGFVFNYDKLLITTGSSVKEPSLEVKYLKSNENILLNHKNVYMLRTIKDSHKLNRDITKNKVKNIVLVGGGFISTELAYYLKSTYRDINVTLVINGLSPLENLFGREVGTIFLSIMKEIGINIIPNSKIQLIEEDDGKINKVFLNDGHIIETDMIIFGIGTKPNTEFLKGVVRLDEENHIDSNLYMGTSQKDIFCAGDISSIPFIHNGVKYNDNHLVSAQQQGAIAARNMLNHNVPYDYIPSYTVYLGDRQFNFVGFCNDYDEIFIDGDLYNYQFMAYYIRNKKVVGFGSMGISNVNNIMYEALKENIVPNASFFKNGSISLFDIADSLNTFKSRCRRSCDYEHL